MTLWFVFGLMTAAAIFAVLWPLGRSTRAGAGGSESAVYKDQLAEIGRDASAGLIGAPEAEAARVEISRRLLASVDAEQAMPALSTTRFRRAVAVLALVGLPVIAAAFYLPLGSPQLPDVPLASRSRAPSTSEPLDNLVAQVEAHLEKNPTDGRGWNVLAPVLARIGRYDDSVRAFRNSITYNGDSAARRADLGEAMAAAANGVITADAKSEFERAVALDANEVKARYFLGIAAEQDGRSADAASIWRAMLSNAPADAPWRNVVQAALARVGGGPALPALSDDTMAAAQGMSTTDRTAMVQGMVDRLATRLKQDGNDVEGWLRLVRAYMVLGDRDKARGALADARQAVGADAGKLQQLNDGLKNFGLDG
jgi:cytochrome c-type biogenesis protein CcmH